MTRSPDAASVPTLPVEQWMRGEDRVALLAHGQWGLFSTAKTGIQLMRFSSARVLGVVNPAAVGTDAAAAVGMPEKGPVPVFMDLESLIAAGATPPSRVLVAIAPEGGKLPAEMRADVKTAIEHGIPVLSGLHTFLSDDPKLASLAKQHATPLVDLRRPPEDPVVATGAGRSVPVPIVTTTGTDCRSGKMTVAVALREAAREAGLRAAFVATGQTGLLLQPDAGAPIDRVISDFAAGEVERQVRKAARLDDDGGPTAKTPDLILVEGQGALSHPSYSGVTAALLHGSWPDALVMTHVHDRANKTVWTRGPQFPVLPPATEIALARAFLDPVHPTPFAGVALAAPDLSQQEYRAVCAQTEKDTGLFTVDCIREGGGPLLARILATLQRRPNGKRIPNTALDRSV